MLGRWIKQVVLVYSLLILPVPDLSLVLFALNLGSTGSDLGQMTKYACWISSWFIHLQCMRLPNVNVNYTELATFRLLMHRDFCSWYSVELTYGQTPSPASALHILWLQILTGVWDGIAVWWWWWWCSMARMSPFGASYACCYVKLCALRSLSFRPYRLRQWMLSHHSCSHACNQWLDDWKGEWGSRPFLLLFSLYSHFPPP